MAAWQTNGRRAAAEGGNVAVFDHLLLSMIEYPRACGASLRKMRRDIRPIPKTSEDVVKVALERQD